MDDNSVANYLAAEGFLEGNEWDMMCPGDRHTTVLYWIASQTHRLSTRKGLERDYVLIIDGVTSMRAKARVPLLCVF